MINTCSIESRRRALSPCRTDIALLLTAAFALRSAFAIQTAEIPKDAPQDEIMATQAETESMQDWARTVFAGQHLPGHEPVVKVELRRQDHSVLNFGQSCIDTPIKLGQRTFAHGLGTHANSEIVLHLPPGAAEFQAWVGIDNNFDTAGVRGSVEFIVECGGKQLAHTSTLRGTNEPVRLQLPLPPNTTELVLKVDATPDGVGYDQADWADACVVSTTGKIFWADDDRQPFLVTALPFAFRYGGVDSSNFLSAWRRTAESTETPSRILCRAQWEDPKTGLRITANVTAFKRYPAVEWVLEFENAGQKPSPLLQDIQALATPLRTGYARKPVRLHQLVGDVCGERSFLPTETEVEPGKSIVLAAEGGRSSNGAFPFFNVAYGDEGVFSAIGWSGQWRAELVRSPAGPAVLRAGMEKTSLRLEPGEKIRSPRILLMPWKGDRTVAHNRFRRLLLFEYAPRLDGRPVPLPIALQCFDRYVGALPDWGTEARQEQAIKAAHDLGCDAHWLDAAWFEGGFPNGVGNWSCPAQKFPQGLKNLSDLCHKFGMKFILWFEPERVAAATQIAREHPEFVFGADKGGLFKVSDPAARKWLAGLLSQRITEYGIDVYRNDFNIDPLGFWRHADGAERQGITEIRYVEGHYALWDELLAGHPGMMIDNCASGGRRMDLETCHRSVPLWHSDTGCAPGHADWNQTQSYGLNLYVPLFAGCAWTPGAYDVRSAATAGLICQFAFLDAGFSMKEAQAAIAEARENQKYWYGDFYPLTPATLGPGAMLAYQFHRSDLDSGIVLAFRRSECPYPVLQAGLRALKSGRVYHVLFIDEERKQTARDITGKELTSDFELVLPRRGTSLLLRYEPAK